MVNISESNFSSESNLPTLVEKNSNGLSIVHWWTFDASHLLVIEAKLFFFKIFFAPSGQTSICSTQIISQLLFSCNYLNDFECCNGMNGKWNVKVVLFKFVFESFSISSLHCKIHVHNWCEWKSEKLEECRVTSSKALTLCFKSSLSHLTLLKWNVLYTIRT